MVPFGGGTSVVGGVEPLIGDHAAVISLDLRRLGDPVTVDAESLTVTVGPGMRGPELEKRLSAHGLTLGHFPQSWEHATLGGYAATRSSGQASSGYGRFDEAVIALRLATPAGTLTLGRGPASAAGPDLKSLALGSEGVFGVITELTLRVRRLPEIVHDEGWSFRTFGDGVMALRRLTQAGLAPEIARLSDADETRANLALAGGSKTRVLRGMLAARGHRAGCLLIAGWEGPRLVVRDRRTAATALLRQAGGIRLGTAVGEAWRRHRYEGPYTRDDLLDHGAMVETLETATSWTDVLGLYDTIRSALRSELTRDGARPLVMAHVSHLYPTGASLYFTALARRDDTDAGRPMAARQGPGHRRDHLGRRHDHPPPRRRHRPSAVAGRGDRHAGHRGAPCREVGARPGRNPQSRQADSGPEDRPVDDIARGTVRGQARPRTARGGPNPE